MKRRKFVEASLAAGAGIASISATPYIPGKTQKLFRIVHLTDMHIFPSAKVEKAMGVLLGKINSMDEKPDFILNTGDNIMDALKQSKEEVHEQWQSWMQYFKNKLELPMYSCIGNHDVWGWASSAETIKNDPLYGKTWAISMLGLEGRYYSFENKGWKFICLDSTHFADNSRGYTAKLDTGQLKWLKSELEGSNPAIPICIVSHIPILSASVFYDGDNSKSGNWEIPGEWMHIDSKKIKGLFYKHPNVKAALSGHVHLADKTEYLKVHYHCNGAVCGKWWNGSYQEFAPSYAVVDFYDNGMVNSELIPYEI